MADKNQIAAELEHLLNNEQQKAEEMFHEYVVGKSREIYENLIDSEIDEEVKDEDLDETADEDLDETNEDDLDENFEDITAEGDDETGDLETDIAAPGEEDEEEFGGEEEGEEEGDDDEPATKGDQTVREYVEKVPAGHGAEKKGAAEKADNTKSSVAGKNDMGGTTANILSSKEDSPSYAGAGGTIKGNGLTKQKPQDMNTGNVNVVGGTNAKAFYSKNSQGHGAEKKGTAESGVDATSIIRGSR